MTNGKKKIKKRLPPSSRSILGVVYRSAGRPLKTREIARRTGLSWPTVNRHLQKLIGMGYVKPSKRRKKRK